jgi:hypothetical protein
MQLEASSVDKVTADAAKLCVALGAVHSCLDVLAAHAWDSRSREAFHDFDGGLQRLVDFQFSFVIYGRLRAAARARNANVSDLSVAREDARLAHAVPAGQRDGEAEQV